MNINGTQNADDKMEKNWQELKGAVLSAVETTIGQNIKTTYERLTRAEA